MATPYTVKFGRFDPDPKKIRWTVVSEVVEDSFIPPGTHRSITTSQGIRLEIPIEGMVFEFSKERQREVDRRVAENAKREEQPGRS